MTHLMTHLMHQTRNEYFLLRFPLFPYTGALDADLGDPGILVHQTSLMDQMNVPHETHLMFDASN